MLLYPGTGFRPREDAMRCVQSVICSPRAERLVRWHATDQKEGLACIESHTIKIWFVNDQAEIK